MLKKTITYVDYNDNEVTEDFYFNITRSELTEMEVSIEGGMREALTTISKTGDVKEMLAMFKRIILSSVGIKTEDGKRFIKSDEISKAFADSPAYDELFFSLTTDADKAAEFVKGMLPKDIAGQLPNEINDETLAKMLGEAQ